MNMLPAPIKNFIDALFNPALTFLDMVLEYLGSISLIAGKGINLSQYLSFFSYLPDSMQAVIQSIISAVMFLAILQLIKYIMKMYYAVKDAVQWW